MHLLFRHERDPEGQSHANYVAAVNPPSRCPIVRHIWRKSTSQQTSSSARFSTSPLADATTGTSHDWPSIFCFTSLRQPSPANGTLPSPASRWQRTQAKLPRFFVGRDAFGISDFRYFALALCCELLDTNNVSGSVFELTKQQLAYGKYQYNVSTKSKSSG